MIVALAVWWLWMPVGATLIWLIKHEIFGGFGQQDQSYVLVLKDDLFPYGSLLHPTPLFWIWVCIGLIGTLVIVGVSEGRTDRFMSGAAVVVVVAFGFSFFYAWTGLWDNDKIAARYYEQPTTFYVTSLDPAPSSLLSLTATARPSGGGACDDVGTADVPSCVKVAPALNFDFDPRTASFEAADAVMSHSSALASQVNVMSPTIHYLPGTTTGQGVWTGILDGSGTRPAEGVAVWDGQSNTASICQFQGGDQFDRAFGGWGGNSLRNLLAQRFPDLLYADHDMWGYCDGTGATARPVIVVPVETDIGVRSRTVLQPAGILVLTGSPDGNPSVTYQASVQPGQYPGQVYPETIASTQVDAINWAAGRGDMDDAGFGYQRTSTDTNTSNPGQYLLRSNTDGHFYFVTPLMPRNSTSQAVVAYAVERADEVSEGLNPLAVYVQSDSVHSPSLTVLQSRMTSYINQVAPGLLTNGAGGELTEIIPFGQGMWRGFVDIGGITQDYIDLSSDATVPPTLVPLNGRTPSGNQAAPSSASPPSGAPADCGAAPATMTVSQITQCIQQFVNALNQRAQPSPTSTGG